MDAGDAAVEVVGGIEEGGVEVSELGAEGEEEGVVFAFVDAAEELDGASGADGPLAEEAADDADGDAGEGEGGEEVGDDVVVVAGVEGDAGGAAGFGDGADDVEGLVAVEGGDLDGDEGLDFGGAAPEGVGQDAAADGGLEVEADDGEDLADGAEVVDHLIDGGVLEGGEGEEGGVVAEGGGERGFAEGLGRGAADAGDEDGVRGAGLFGGELEDGLEEVVLGVADGELGGVDGDGEAAGAGVDVVAREGALAGLVELAVRGEAEGVGGDDEALVETIAPAHMRILLQSGAGALTSFQISFRWGRWGRAR